VAEEVQIHTGTQVKLKLLEKDQIPATFLRQLQELGHRERQVEAVYVFGIQPENEEERIALVLAIRGGLFSNRSEEFLRLVEEIQISLPPDLPINVYRFGSSHLVAAFCLQTLEPVYLRSADWVRKQRKRFAG